MLLVSDSKTYSYQQVTTWSFEEDQHEQVTTWNFEEDQQDEILVDPLVQNKIKKCFKINCIIETVNTNI